MRFASCLFVAAILSSRFVAPAAEIAVLSEATWAEFAPAGKEVDAIYGDIVMRNDKLVAVIGAPLDTRNANMTVKNVGGCLIDFTTREKPNDQLAAFYPLGKAVNWRTLKTEPPLGDDGKPAGGKVVTVRISTELRPKELSAETTYVLSDGADYLVVGTTLKNLGDKPLKYTTKDELNIQGAPVKGTTGELAWVYDRWWDAAYGVINDMPTGFEPEIPVNGTLSYSRKLFVAGGLHHLQAAADAVQDIPRDAAVLTVLLGGMIKPVPGAYVEIVDDAKQVLTAGKTDKNGKFASQFEGTASVSHPNHGQASAPLIVPRVGVGRTIVMFNGKRIDNAVTLPISGKFVATITAERGGPTPCKLMFRGVEPTKDPVFFDKTGEHAVGNLYYSHDGKFALDLPPGKYDVTVSHGTEYDIVEQQIEIASGSQTPLEATLVRSVQTPGWISSDFHSHSSPSGDNTSSQFGRVLNLLAEHIEFAPCTEHNRVSTYLPHLERLQAKHLMATCSGIELTGADLPLNHHNAFPLKLHEHRQDGGGPAVDQDKEVAVERLVLWDDRSHKLIQQNHPDLGHVFFDKNGDGKPDAGHQRALGHLDCIEVHPPQSIFKKPTIEGKNGGYSNNTIFNWLQLLNQGYRIPGVVNTDAHYNIHGSGWLRNYIACSTDDPAKIDIHEMVHAAEDGHMVMTNAPYLEVKLRAGSASGGPGDELAAPGGKAALHVRVQCANWYDVDRVQLFLNGRPNAKLNFTRAANPDMFSDEVVKFDRELPLELPGDTHVIVVAIGENSGLGHVMGPEHEKDKPCAVSNPIFIDVDGNGFTANKDTLDAPLPVKAGTAK